MNILVTGGTGFVGRRLMKRLCENGHEVRCLVRNPTSKTDITNIDSVEIWEGDLTKRETLKGICNGIDVVFHLAAIGDINALSEKYMELYRKVNVEGTKNLLNECSKNEKIRKIVHFSSIAAIGETDSEIITESNKCNPETPYEKSKRESELVAMEFFKKGLPIVILRPAMIYGKGENKESNKIMKSVKLRLVPILGDGNNEIHMVHVDDVCEIAIRMVNRGIPGEIYNIWGESHTWNELVDIIAENEGIGIKKIHIPIFAVKPFLRLLDKFSMIFGFIAPFTCRRLESFKKKREYDTSKLKDAIDFIPENKLKSKK